MIIIVIYFSCDLSKLNTLTTLSCVQNLVNVSRLFYEVKSTYKNITQNVPGIVVGKVLKSRATIFRVKADLVAFTFSTVSCKYFIQIKCGLTRGGFGPSNSVSLTASTSARLFGSENMPSRESIVPYIFHVKKGEKSESRTCQAATISIATKSFNEDFAELIHCQHWIVVSIIETSKLSIIARLIRRSKRRH